MARQPARPRTPAELLRSFDDRIRALEHRTAIVLGVPPNAYVLEVNAAGELVATNTTTGTSSTVALP